MRHGRFPCRTHEARPVSLLGEMRRTYDQADAIVKNSTCNSQRARRFASAGKEENAQKLKELLGPWPRKCLVLQVGIKKRCVVFWTQCLMTAVTWWCQWLRTQSGKTALTHTLFHQFQNIQSLESFQTEPSPVFPFWGKVSLSPAPRRPSVGPALFLNLITKSNKKKNSDLAICVKCNAWKLRRVGTRYGIGDGDT